MSHKVKNSIIDISPLIHEQSAVFPGDQPYQRSIAISFDQGQHLLLSSVKHTLHIGAHADASNHYHPSGQGIDQRSLHHYLGPCQVLSIQARPGERIRPQHFAEKEIHCKRVLFKTLSFPNPDRWQENFNSLCPQTIELLAGKGVHLVGIDTPSIDPHDSKALESHQMIYQHNMAVLEGLDLSKTEEGIYLLIALPIKYAQADAAPVRAVLLKNWQDIGAKDD